MPELPEVETIRRALEPELRGRVIARVRVRRPDVISHPESVRAFTRRLSGCRFDGLSRRGKYLLFELTGGRLLVVHLRLSGHLALVDGRSEVSRHERVRLELDDGRALSFVEPRALGRMYCLLPGETPKVLANMRAMGPEPIERGVGGSHLAGWLRGRKASVKALLLDQRVCCGVGNI
ncbi:MAG: DNA-formamidopyrimidine glycosylase family protein, partial [candidate division WOR-3 bacterium]